MTKRILKILSLLTVCCIIGACSLYRVNPKYYINNDKINSFLSTYFYDIYCMKVNGYIDVKYIYVSKNKHGENFVYVNYTHNPNPYENGVLKMYYTLASMKKPPKIRYISDDEIEKIFTYFK